MSAFESEITKSIKAMNDIANPVWYYKLPTPALHHLGKQPFDYLVIIQKKKSSRVLGIECKMIRGSSLSFIPEHQEFGLKKINSMRCCHGLLLINHRIKHEINQCFHIDIISYLHLKSACIENGRKSIPLDLIKELGNEIPRKKGLWRLDFIF